MNFDFHTFCRLPFSLEIGPVRAGPVSFEFKKSDRAGQLKFEINRTGPGRAAAAVGPGRAGQFLRKIGPGRPAWSDYFPKQDINLRE